MNESAACTARRCASCEVLPVPATGPGELHLWFPIGHTRGKVAALLRGRAWPFRLEGDDRLVVAVEAGALDTVAPPIEGALTSVEAAATRVLFRAGGGEPTACDIPRVQSGAQFVAATQSGWLLAMLAEGRLTSHFQPIVHADEPGRVFAQELLLRGIGTDGALVPPGRMFDAARATGLLFHLDLAARRTAIRTAVAHGVGEALFINFAPTAIYDPATCLRSTVAAIEEAGVPPEKVVFEIVETERTADVTHLRRILDFYREAGFRVALDDVGSGYSSLNLVHQLRPDFIKLDMDLTRNVCNDATKATVASTILDLAARLGTPTIAEGVETLEEYGWMLRHGATYVQGWLVSRPSAVPVRASGVVMAPADAPRAAGVAMPA